MPKRPTKPTDASRLAKLLEAAYLEAYIAHNPRHDKPEWGLLGRHLYGRVLEAIAVNLLAKGISLPCKSASPSKAKSSKRRESSKSEDSLTSSQGSTTPSTGLSLFR